MTGLLGPLGAATAPVLVLLAAWGVRRRLDRRLARDGAHTDPASAAAWMPYLQQAVPVHAQRYGLSMGDAARNLTDAVCAPSLLERAIADDTVSIYDVIALAEQRALPPPRELTPATLRMAATSVEAAARWLGGVHTRSDGSRWRVVSVGPLGELTWTPAS